MRNFNPQEKSYDRENPHRDQSGFNREDSNRHTSTSGYQMFAKDKRTRTKRVEKVSRPEHSEERTERERPHHPQQRHSFNPNFTKDNRKVNDEKEYSTSRSSRRSDHAERFDNKEERNKRPRTFLKSKEASQHSHNRRPGQRSRGPVYNSENYPKFPAPKLDGAIRLNRYLAMSGICSRREADDFITAGVVSVNGQVVTELGTKVFPTDVVKFNDSVVRNEKKVYIVMNKPKGFVTTLEDPHADKTVMELLKNACTERVYPVGRLDKNSVGVLLITNDGDLTKRLTHPTYNKKKVYQVSLDKALTRADMLQIAEGIELEDGEIHADEISYVKENKREIGIEIHSGRNRIIRRIFEHLGYKVQKLDRVYFAGLTKKGLKRGGWRFLTPKEVEILQSGKYE